MSLKMQPIILWILRLISALILLQTLYFKFTGAEESVYIFTKLGMEPWGRIGTGVLELIASILILYPAATGLGALLGMGLMSGALFFHFTSLGFAVKGDGGLLFIYGLVVFISCLLMVIICRDQIMKIIKSLL